MLSIIIAIICCILTCIPPCCSDQFCDIERWVVDNGMPINKLEISGPSKSKLVQSLLLPDKIIKCSVLRLIHREAELDRPFKQNRYKVKLPIVRKDASKEAETRRFSDQRDNSESHGFRHGEDNGARLDDRHEDNRKDAAPPASDRSLDREHQTPSRNEQTGSAIDDSQRPLPNELQSQELQSKLFIDSQLQPTERQQAPVLNDAPPTSDGTLSSSTIENPATKIDPAAVESTASTLQNPAFEARTETPANPIDNTLTLTADNVVDTTNRVIGDQKPTIQDPSVTVKEAALEANSTMSSSNVSAPNGTALLPNATEASVTDGGSMTATEGPTSSDAGAKQNSSVDQEETKMAERLKSYFNEGGNNQTKDFSSLNHTSLPYNETTDFLRNCITCPLTFPSAQSWKFCHYFYPKDLSILAPNESLPVNHTCSARNSSLSLFIRLCRTSSNDSHSRHRSNLFCAVFFSFSGMRELTTKVEGHPISKSNNLLAKASLLSCLQCPAAVLTSSNRSAIAATVWQNRTHSICIFITASYHQPPAIDKYQHQKLVDQLQFIDDASGTGSAARVQLPIGGGEMQETKLPTRVRHEAATKLDLESGQSDQPNVASNKTIIASISPDATNALSESNNEINKHLSNTNDKSVQLDVPLNSNETTSVDTSSDTDNITARQLDILSHSVFMEKLFDSLLTKRNASLHSSNSTANLTMRVDSLSTKLDQLDTTMSLKTNKSELVQIKSALLSLETRFSRALAHIVRRNLKLVESFRKLEIATSTKLFACHNELNEVKSNFKLISDSHSAQLLQMKRRMLQLSSRVSSLPHYQTPEIPHQYQQSHHQVATATLPSLHDSLTVEDCSDVYFRGKKTGQAFDKSNEELFQLNTGLSRPVKARCDLKNGGWTYILSRSDGKTDFYRNWTSYRTGFGDPSGEYFIGLETLAEMTSRRRYMLRVDLEDWEGSIRNVSYGQFQVFGEKQHFQLRVDNFNGDASVGDSLTSHSNASFSTYDLDNDLVESKFGGNCATRFHGGFWYFSCYRANPTGRYYNGGRIPDKRCDGIVWKTWKGPHYSLRAFHMKIRPLHSS